MIQSAGFSAPQLEELVANIHKSLADQCVDPNDDASAFLNLLVLRKAEQNLDTVRREVVMKKIDSETNQRSFRWSQGSGPSAEITKLSEDVRGLQKLLNDQIFLNQNALEVSETEPSKEESIEPQQESMQELRKRLLSTNNTSQLDELDKDSSSNFKMESLQEEYVKDITHAIRGLKDTALQFQQALKEDAAILMKTSDNVEKSQGKMSNVSKLLKTYNKDKKLGWIFYGIMAISVFLVFYIILHIIFFVSAK